MMTLREKERIALAPIPLPRAARPRPASTDGQTTGQAAVLTLLRCVKAMAVRLVEIEKATGATASQRRTPR